MDEKNEFSFGLFDEDFDGQINFEDMYFVMKKFMSHFSTLLGNTTMVDKDALKQIFDTIDVDNNEIISLEEYKMVLRKKPGLFSWFDILSGQKFQTDAPTNYSEEGSLQQSFMKRANQEQEEELQKRL